MDTRQQQPERILRLAEVKQRCGIGRSAIYERVKLGTFPRPVTLGTRRDGRPALIGFAESEINAWIARTIADGRSAA